MITIQLNLTGENKTFKNREQNRENKGVQRTFRYFWRNLVHTN